MKCSQADKTHLVGFRYVRHFVTMRVRHGENCVLRLVSLDMIGMSLIAHVFSHSAHFCVAQHVRSIIARV